MTRRGRSPSVKCAVGSSCTSLHSPNDAQGTFPCNYLSLSPNPPPKRYSSIPYRATDAFGADSSRQIGPDMEEPLKVSKDVAVPTTPKNDSQPPAATSLDPQPSKERNEPSQNPLADLFARWDREKATREAEAAAKRALPCGITEKFLLAFSILDLAVRLILLLILWCCSTRWPSTDGGGGGGPATIQVTIAYFIPPATLVGFWRWAFARSMIGEGGVEGDRILELVGRTDMAALGVAGALIVSLAVHVGLSWAWWCEGM